MKANWTAGQLSEHAYLCYYRSALLKAVKIENGVQHNNATMNYYGPNSNTFFSPAEAQLIKQELGKKVELLLIQFTNGDYSLEEFHVQLDSCLRQLGVLTYNKGL